MEDGDDVETNILCRIGNYADDAGYAVTAKLLSDRAEIGGACGFHRVQVGEITEKDKAGFEAGRKNLYGLKNGLHLSGPDVPLLPRLRVWPGSAALQEIMESTNR